MRTWLGVVAVVVLLTACDPIDALETMAPQPPDPPTPLASAVRVSNGWVTDPPTLWRLRGPAIRRG